MNTPIRFLVIFVLTAIMAACGGDEGADSISSHKSLNGGDTPDCSLCHTGSLDPVVTNGTGTDGKHVAHVSEKGLSCIECHLNYSDSPSHMNGVLDTTDSSVNMISFDSPNLNGQWADDTGALTGNCSSVNCHGADSPGWYGPVSWTMPDDCTQCHSSGSEIDPVTTGGTGTAGKHTAHVSSISISCSECHEGYSSNAKHMNGQIDIEDQTDAVVFDATNPDGAWADYTGPQEGSCENINCHGGDIVEWYQTDDWDLPATCSYCHSASIGTRRQIFGTGGDFESNPSITSGHLTGGGDPTAAQCAICHSMESHTSGTVKLLDADTGTIMVYSAATPSSLENFCISCHDANGRNGVMNPLVVSKTLGTIPYTAGAYIKSYWTNTSNTHKNSGLTCAGTGLSNTGCHGRSGAINMHGSNVKGLLTSNMNFNIPLSFDANPAPPVSHYDYNNYKLCFDCHENYSSVTKEVVLGYEDDGNYDITEAPTPYYTPTNIGIRSLFRDQWSDGLPPLPSYDDSMFGYLFLPLHNYHLLGSGFQGSTDVVVTWYYRGDQSQEVRITCTACHNVHGTNNTVRSTYEELGIISYETGTDKYKTPEPVVILPNFVEEVMLKQPINCATGCHFNSWTSNQEYDSYWYEPKNE